MNAHREKTSGVMGFVVSILLHAIFFAGCLALDFTKRDSSPNIDSTEINQLTHQAQSIKPKS